VLPDDFDHGGEKLVQQQPWGIGKWLATPQNELRVVNNNAFRI
jgi:hypothetical protein